jgi:hypothetical protein
MAHFAKIENNTVVNVIVSEQDFINSGMVGDSFNWVQTSYNNSFRYNYASIGYTYDKIKDAFIAPKPFPSWLLNSSTQKWESPKPHPADGMYVWNESNLEWEIE